MGAPLPSAGGDSKPFSFLSTPANEQGGTFSPDGRWVAYESDESGSNEIYVRPFPPSNRGKWPISTNGSSSVRAVGRPWWRQDGAELGYVAADGSVISVPVTTNPVFQRGEPKMLFKLPLNASLFEPAPDRSMFLVAVPVGGAGSAPEPFKVVLNWQTGLKK